MNRRIQGIRTFKKEVGERFILSLRAIYRNHPHYFYRESVRASNLLIEISYADIHYEGKVPQFLVKVGSYNKDLTDTLGQNVKEAVYEEGSLVGYKHLKIVRLPITVIVKAKAEEECSDLADELADMGLLFAKEVFSKAGIIMMGAHVSETDLFDQEQKVWQTSVVFTVDVPWTYIVKSNIKVDGYGFDIFTENELDENGNEICPSKVVECDMPYRRPGVEVYREFIDKNTE